MRRYKKYPNRRLYDQDRSTYVTVEDVRREIVRGESIEVRDSREDRDITRTVLLQILAEQEEQGHEPILTNRAIEQIIRFYGDRFGGLVSGYIEQGILTFLEHQDQYRERLRKMAEVDPLNVMRQAMEFLDPTRGGPARRGEGDRGRDDGRDGGPEGGKE